MRILRYAAISILGLGALCTAGCGSDPATTTTPPPPPPAPGAPASITVQAGDGESAAINAAVPICPIVIVKDAAGVPVPGVVVTFTVDAGGGAITGGNVTTGADGIATIGSWTLGPNPGSNVLRVSVNGVTPKLITATATAAAVTLATNYPIASGGGSFSYSKAGDALNGLVLSVPAAAFGHATQWSITSQPGAPPSLPADAFLVAPMLTITNNELYADSLIRLRIPVKAGADTAVAAFFYDPDLGTLEMAPIIGREAGAVTIVSRHFSADQLLARAATFPAQLIAGGASSIGQARRATSLLASVFAMAHASAARGSIYVSVVGVKRAALLAKQISTTFDPAVDTWEFENLPTWASGGGGISGGMAITEVDYNVRYKPLTGALSGKFYKGPGSSSFWGDDPAGLRMATVTDSVMDKFLSKVYVPASGSFPATLLIGQDKQVFDAVCIAMYVTGQPQILMALGTSLLHGIVIQGAQPGHLAFVDPNSPQTTFSLPFNGTNFTPAVLDDYAGSSDLPVSGYLTVPISSLVSSARLAADWAKTKAGTIGNPEFPSLPLEYFNYATTTWDPVPSGDTLRIASDTFLVRNNCGNCPRLRTASQLATRQYLGVFDDTGLAVASDLPDVLRGALVRMNPATRTLGLMSSAYAPDPGGPFLYSDFRWLTVVSTVATIGPRDLSGPVDSLYKFIVRPPGALPPGTSYKWTVTLPPNAPFVGTTPDTTFSIRLADIGVYRVKVEVVNANLGVLGSDSTTLTTNPLQVAIDQRPFIRAYPGDPKTLSATVNGFMPASVRYDWVFGDQGVTRVPTTVPTTTHSWSTLGTYTASVAMRDPTANTLLGGSFTEVQVKNWAGAWLITSFTKTAETATNPNTVPRDVQAWIQMRDTLTQIELGKVAALIFLDDSQLWTEQAVYLEIFPPGNLFLDLYYWQPGGLITQLARTTAIQFSNYNQTGNTRNGILNGVGYVTTLNGSFLNSINAVKTQNQLTGTMTIGLYSVLGVHGSKSYQFTATRVSP